MNLSFFAFVFFVFVAQQQCGKPAAPEVAAVSNVPACVLEKIEAIKKEPRWNPPAEVQEYRYDGRRVFLFSSNCCDQFNTVVDENCNYICAPSGGITGKGDRKCDDFAGQAQLVRVVWKDERK